MFSFELVFKMRQTIFKNHIQNFSPKNISTLTYLVIFKMCLFMIKLLLRKYKPEKKETSWAVAQLTQSFEKTRIEWIYQQRESQFSMVYSTELCQRQWIETNWESHSYPHMHAHSINRQYVTCTTSSCKTSFDTDLCLMPQKKTKIPIFHFDICELLPSKLS